MFGVYTTLQALKIVLQCGVCPGSLFVFDMFIHHTRSNDFWDVQAIPP